VELLRREKPEFIAPDMWLPNSSDIKLIDYCIWGVMQERVYHTAIHKNDRLRLLYLDKRHNYIGDPHFNSTHLMLNSLSQYETK